MSRVTSYKCDACAVLIPQDKPRCVVTLTIPAGKFAADLCEKCAGDVRGMATFSMKARAKRRTAVAA